MASSPCPAARVRCSLVAVALTACSSSSGAEPAARLRVVASTDVYGDIARAVAGTHADITSFIDDPAQDPHSYEANARNQLAISKADVVIENGGGYDDFVDRMRVGGRRARRDRAQRRRRCPARRRRRAANSTSTSGTTSPTVAEARRPARRALVAPRIRATAADVRRATRRRSSAELHGLERTEAAIRASARRRRRRDHRARAAVPAQRVRPGQQDPGRRSARPSRTAPDVSATVLQQTLDLFSSQPVRALVYNEQTSGPGDRRRCSTRPRPTSVAGRAGHRDPAGRHELPVAGCRPTWPRCDRRWRHDALASSNCATPRSPSATGCCGRS